jgi:hypothetical protein
MVIQKKAGVLVCLAILAGVAGYSGFAPNPNPFRKTDAPLDSLDGVVVFYNGRVSRTEGRHLSEGGYNLGLKWQCVEFVKRYYFEVYHHSFPDSYGHAKDFFDPAVLPGNINPARNLRQFANGSSACPVKGDILVLGASRWNPYGHVAIVTDVKHDRVMIIQQNAGPFGKTRTSLSLEVENGLYKMPESVLGWLRMPEMI